MKKIILFVLVSVSLISCNAVKKAQSWATQHCHEQHSFDPFAGEYHIQWVCDTLYPTQKVNSKCNQLNVCFDAAHGKFYGDIKCDSLYPIGQLVPMMIPSFKK